MKVETGVTAEKARVERRLGVKSTALDPERLRGYITVFFKLTLKNTYNWKARQLNLC